MSLSSLPMTDLPIPDLPVPDWQAISQIPIHESAEAFQAISLSPKIRTWPAYFKMGIAHTMPECYIREGVYQRLLEATRYLPEHLTLVVLDGWRPFKVQQFLYETFLSLLAEAHPDWDEAQRIFQARQLVSPPSTDPKAPSPHITGGSIDVTLMDADGCLLNMGTLFDEASPLAFSAAFENRNDLTASQQEARDHRRLLYHAMRQAGFTNLPTEWWHYDYGNQMWAWHRLEAGEINAESAQAHYGVSHPHTLEHTWRSQLGLSH